MATISAVILKADQKQDGTWNVKIRIWHKSKPAYIDTEHYVGKNQVGKKSKTNPAPIIKDTFILDRVAPKLRKYRDWISDNVDTVEFISAQEIKQALLAHDKGGDYSAEIDFLKFSLSFIQKKEASKQSSSAGPLVTVYNSLKDYFKSDSVGISQINYRFLRDYEQYLRAERILTRNKNGGGTYEQVRKGLSDAGLHNHMRDLRLLFNEARDYYNDEDEGVIRIAHYPFKKYKVGTPPLTKHKDRPVNEIVFIRDMEVITKDQEKEYLQFIKNNPDQVPDRKYIVEGSRAELARDLGMLSLYLCGMNAADLYELPTKIGDRYGYNRSKTRDKRKDKAFISIKIVDQARPFLDKYAGKLQKRYVNEEGLNKALDNGFKILSRSSGIPDLGFYDFRHCVGSWARNICDFHKEDVARALNQTERTVTDVYISPDWSMVDKVQAAIIGLLENKNNG